MCRSGVNLTQFKLSLHHLQKFNEVLGRSLKQWQEVLEPLGFLELASLAKDASIKTEEAGEKIKALLAKTTNAEALGSDDIKITPL